MGTFWLDVRSGVRAVVRRPLFSAVVILTVALGIGGNAAIFGLLNGIFLRPFPFGDADRLVRLSGFDRERGFDNMSVSVPDFVDWREQSQTLERVVAFDGASFNLASGERPERISGARVSAGLFEAFGVVPIHGRTFRPDDERPGAPQVVILGEGLWQRRFGGDAGLVGDEIRLDGRPHTVVGIVPAGFE
ncbi:MAG TPA: ABC transporter permease, partial [Thermoanaerobaculia bacterium]|nr:ABC transporter permease [Thermoanaerobaculia bacterium]